MLVVGIHQQTLSLCSQMPLRSDVPLLGCLSAHSCRVLSGWYLWVCVGAAACKEPAWELFLMCASSLCGRRRHPDLCWWSRCLAEVSFVGDRQEFPVNSPGIPPPSGLGSCGQCPSPGSASRGLRAPLSDSRWLPMSLVRVPGNIKTTPGTVLKLVGGGTAVLEELQAMDVALVGMAAFAMCLSLSGCSQAPGSFQLLALSAQQSPRNGGAADGDSKHESWCGLRGLCPDL